MLELLNQLDGFDERGDVKVIMATNRIESLDPALIRPGRIDRKIEFPLPDTKTKRHIFNIHTNRMTLSEDVDLEKFVMAKDELSGADIKAVCTEAGMLALRERRMKVCQEDFVKAKEKALYRKKGTFAKESVQYSISWLVLTASLSLSPSSRMQATYRKDCTCKRSESLWAGRKGRIGRGEDGRTPYAIALTLFSMHYMPARRVTRCR